jgi:hypothetical protein
MRTVSETHAGTNQADTEATRRVYIRALELWPDDPDPDPQSRGVWRGAAAILIAGLATIVLISAAVLETTHRAALGIWVWLGMPLLLLASAAARVAAGWRRAHASDGRPTPIRKPVGPSTDRARAGTPATPMANMVSNLDNKGPYREAVTFVTSNRRSR